MQTVWRIADKRYKTTALSGEGARLFGGRWNSPGLRIVYTSESQSLSILELLVHLDSPALLNEFVLYAVEIDTSHITHVDRLALPSNWKDDPVPEEVKSIGDKWAVARSSVALSVPSALVPGESNYLLNPQHTDFSKLKIGKPLPFQFDPRFSSKHR